ncbi:MAG: DMT family transporter [Betaproteobacteria bacterium]
MIHGERLKGVLYMLGASVCLSTGGLLVRLVESTPPAALVVWRCVVMFLFLAALLGVRHGRSLVAKVHSGGRPGAISAMFLAATFGLFIFAVTRTSVANAAALMSTGPLMLTVAAWAFLGEKPRSATWLAIAAALGGIALMFADGIGSGGVITGNLLALCIPASFTVSYILLRRSPARLDPTNTSMLAALFAAIAVLPFAWPVAWPTQDLPVILTMGVAQTGMGLALMSQAINRLTAGELGMVGLLEMALAPVWVWLVLGERPADAALAGGAIVVGAVFLNQLYALRTPRGKRSANAVL